MERALNLSIQAFLRPNALYPPFDNPKARLALAYIVDQADIMAAGYRRRKVLASLQRLLCMRRSAWHGGRDRGF